MEGFICGFELHLPLNCKTKLFCSCSAASKDAKPNTSVCPTCLGLPGSKPVLNKKSVEYALKLALSLRCTIEKEIVFSRKTYFYPDLAKNFQISQYDAPLGNNGFVELESGKIIRIRRVHLEEDPGSLVHEGGLYSSQYVLVDYNRSGIALCEIVTEPDITSLQEAGEFLEKLTRIISYLDVFDPSKGVVKADTNISIKGSGRVEVKNVTGAKNVKATLAFEFARQKELISKGEKVERETRGFDEEAVSTYMLRKKETEEDYGFIADTDLVPTIITADYIALIRRQLPEMPEQKSTRFVGIYGLKPYDAKVLALNKKLADIFEQAAKIDVQIALRIVSRELLGILNYNSLLLENTKISGKGISGLAVLLKESRVSDKNAKDSLIKYALEGIEPMEFLQKNNLLIDSSNIENVVQEVIVQNQNAFEEFKSGSSKSLNFLIGLVMRKVKGRADARLVQKIFESMK